MKSQVSFVTQLGVVLLATGFTLEGHFVGIVSLKVIFQMVLSVEGLFTVTTLVRFLWRVGGRVPKTEEQQHVYGTHAHKWNTASECEGTCAL